MLSASFSQAAKVDYTTDTLSLCGQNYRMSKLFPNIDSNMSELLRIIDMQDKTSRDTGMRYLSDLLNSNLTPEEKSLEQVQEFQSYLKDKTFVRATTYSKWAHYADEGDRVHSETMYLAAAAETLQAKRVYSCSSEISPVIKKLILIGELASLLRVATSFY